LTVTAATDAELIALQEVVAGRYVVEREIGRGGMGVVYLARDLSLDRHVAIKLLPPALGTQPELRERFLRETRIAAGLSHPNIVAIHAVEEQGGLVFFVMGYVDGETLKERVTRAGALAPGEVARVLQEAGWALSYAHGRGIVHRDVKADNILVERGTGRALLTDFGIARISNSTMTAAGTSLGTPQYMSPEQATGEEVDARSDIYSLGIVGFYALTGRLPFDAPSLQAVLAMQVTRPAPPVGSARPGTPPRLAEAIDRCLQKDASDRFQSAEALVEAVQGARGAAAEIAPAVRNFQRTAEVSTNQVTVILFVLTMLAIARPVAADLIGVMMGLMPIAVLFQFAPRVRALLRQGYTYEDVRAAFAIESRQRQEELDVALAANPPLTGWRAWRVPLLTAAIGLAIIVVAIRTGVESPKGSSMRRAMKILSGIGGGIMGGGLMLRAVNNQRFERRLARAGQAVWAGRFGEWFFRVVGRPKATRAAGAADAAPTSDVRTLLAALPGATRRALGDAAGVVAGLEAEARTLERREQDLGRALDEAGVEAKRGGDREASGTATALASRRAALIDELHEERRRVAERREAVLAALENVRVQLLRLRAGFGRPGDLAPDLEAARALLDRRG
jgi:serine/threonine-protein kinase